MEAGGGHVFVHRARGSQQRDRDRMKDFKSSGKMLHFHYESSRHV